MTATTSAIARGGAAVAVVVVCAALGAVAVTIGAITTPLAVIALPVLVAAPVAMVQRPVLVPLVFLLALPIGAARLPAPLSRQVIEAVALLGVGAILLRGLLLWQPPLRVAPAARWALGLAATTALAAVMADDTSLAVPHAVLVVTAIAFGLAVARAIGGWQQLRVVTVVAVVVAAGVCASALPSATALDPAYDGGVVAGRAVGIFTHPNELGAFAGTTLFLAVGVRMTDPSRPVRAAALAAMGLSSAALLLSLSRGAWIGTFVAGVLLAVVARGERRRLLGLLAVAVVIIGILATVVPVPLDVFQDRLATVADPASNPYDERPVIWRTAVDLALENPWTGVGPASFPAASGRVTSAGMIRPLHAHNVPLTVAVEGGVVALLALVGFTAHLAVSTYRTATAARRNGERGRSTLLLCIGAAFAVHLGQGLVDYTYRNATILMLTWFLIGLVLAAHRLQRPPVGQAAT